MAIESGFFNSVGDDRLYNAEDMSRYFENILSSGVFKRISNCLQVSAGSGMTLAVAAGAGLIDCHWFRARSAESVTIPAAHAILPRIDNVVARLDLTDAVRAITLDVVTGTPAQSPVPVAPVRTTSVYELVLAHVLVPAGASAITDGNITDTREDETLCGFVQSLVDNPILKTYNARYVAVANNTMLVPINVPNYNAGADLLNVYINGFRIAPGTEYTVDAAGTYVYLMQGIEAGAAVDIEVHRPALGDGVATISDGEADLVQTVADLSSDVRALEADTGWLDIPWENGVSSNVNWTARLRRVGKSIYLRGLCTGITANELQVCTIPEGFRPTMGGHAYASFCSSNTGTNTRAARMFINTDGGVVFRSSGNAVPASSDVVAITTSWLID